MGQRAALVMAAVGTASLLYVWAVDPGRISTSAVSWIRIVQTFSIAYLAASVLRTRRDVLVTLGGLVLGTLITTTAALVEVFKDPSAIFATRYEGFVGPNALGLLGGVMVVLGVFGAFGPRWRGRIALILLGGVALLLGKSVGGMVGTGIAIGLGLALRYPSPPLHRATAIVCGVGVSVVIAFGLVQWLRPSATPGSPDFRNSTTSQRTILAAAGLEIWSHHPLIGVGWRRSDSAEVISTRQINIALRTRFQDGRTDFFPDNHETSVHNSYVQVLAEFGVVGFAALIALLIAIGRGLRGVLASIPRGDPLWPLAWVLTLVVVLDLVYFNDTPLYGGQIETVALALVIGCAVAVGRMQARRNAAGP
jgi:O-antigen ligase